MDEPRSLPKILTFSPVLQKYPLKPVGSSKWAGPNTAGQLSRIPSPLRVARLANWGFWAVRTRIVSPWNRFGPCKASPIGNNYLFFSGIFVFPLSCKRSLQILASRRVLYRRIWGMAGATPVFPHLPKTPASRTRSRLLPTLLTLAPEPIHRSPPCYLTFYPADPHRHARKALSGKTLPWR
jgi:hypothetical protein